MDKKDDVFKEFLNQAQHNAQMGAAKMAAEQFKDAIPVVANIMKSLYDEMLRQGFTNQQAFALVKDYGLQILSQNQ